jgi:hypothetical protein
MLSALLILLVSCAPAAPSGTSCAGWRRIVGSAQDTPGTLRQVLAHDDTGRRLGCW